jgi:hypothetical protein
VTIRRFFQRLDAILRPLLDADAQPETAGEVIVAALVPFVLARGVRRPDRVDEFLAELAIVIGEERQGGSLPSTTRVRRTSCSIGSWI